MMNAPDRRFARPVLLDIDEMSRHRADDVQFPRESINMNFPVDRPDVSNGDT